MFNLYCMYNTTIAFNLYCMYNTTIMYNKYLYANILCFSNKLGQVTRVDLSSMSTADTSI